MTTAFLRDLISSLGISDNEALNRLQEVGAISDLCESVEDIGQADVERAAAVLAEGLEAAPA